MTDELTFYKPCKQLQPYVRYYWVLKSRNRFTTLTFPIGCPQIIFHKKSPLFIPELNKFQSPFTISGQVNFPAHVCSAKDTEMVVTVFHPHTIKTFINVSPSSFYNLEISGYDIENKSLNELASQIFDCDDTTRCIQTIEHWLCSTLRDKSVSHLNRIDPVIKNILAAPSTSVTELADIACLGRKQFERIFNHYIGMNPKEYTRIVRFQKSLWLLQNRQNDHIDIAYTNGYADQAHYIRDFKTFSGYTPQKLISKYRPYSDLFTIPI